MIKVKKSTPKEATVNISLDEGTAEELLDIIQVFSSSRSISDNVSELKAELEEIL